MIETTRIWSRMAKLATPVAILASGALVWQGSTAAFSVSTSNASNNWATGGVTLTDDDSDTAMFNATGLLPGATGEKCIVVTYTSANSNADIRMYGTGSGTLANYLTLTIERGTGGSFSDCTGFSPVGTVFTGNLTAWNAVTNYATGVGNHTATSGVARNFTYRVSYAVTNHVDATNKAGAANFTWEAVTP